jgi:predicted flap endonuclease-1-like 5' DNA nuclease
MTIHPLPSTDATTHSLVQERPDTTSAYDSTWAEQPASQAPDGLDRIMGVDGKIYVVLAVVLIIWFGLVALLVRTDRKIDRLERDLDANGS